MSYGSLGYDYVAFKASHNSYDRDESIVEQLRWNDAKRYDGGCRSVEFDIVRHSDGSHGTSISYFQVSHEQGGEGKPLADYLAELQAFHAEDPGHGPVMVCLDIKSKEGDFKVFPDEIDAYLRTWFPKALIFAPGRAIADAGKDLVANLQQNGWPLLSDLTGMFVFCLAGNEQWKSYYADHMPTQRLCFADLDMEVNPLYPFAPEVSGNRAIINLHLYSDQYAMWSVLVPGLRAQRLIVRGWVINGSDLWKKAQGAGVNALATDKISNNEWAVIGTEPFAPAPI